MSVNGFVWGTGPDFVGGASFESIRRIHKGEAGAVQGSGRGNQCCAVAQSHV